MYQDESNRATTKVWHNWVTDQYWVAGDARHTDPQSEDTPPTQRDRHMIIIITLVSAIIPWAFLWWLGFKVAESYDKSMAERRTIP